MADSGIEKHLQGLLLSGLRSVLFPFRSHLTIDVSEGLLGAYPMERIDGDDGYAPVGTSAFLGMPEITSRTSIASGIEVLGLNFDLMIMFGLDGEHDSETKASLMMRALARTLNEVSNLDSFKACGGYPAGINCTARGWHELGQDKVYVISISTTLHLGTGQTFDS